MTRFPRAATRGLAIALLAFGSARAQDPPAADPLAVLDRLEGVWQGEGRGFGQISQVTHTWERVLGSKFLRLTTRSVTEAADGTASVHEDVGYVSWSSGEGVLRFRQFLSEGFVNTFRVDRVDGADAGLDFEPESTEGVHGLVARMTLRWDGTDDYEMILELGADTASLKACQTMNVKRVARGS